MQHWGPPPQQSGRACSGGRGGRHGYQQQQQQQQQQQHRPQRFADYYTPEEVSAGLAAGQLIIGQVHISKGNFEEAFVSHPNGDADVLIGSRIDRNRALSDDEVAVCIKPVASWRVLGFNNAATAVGQQNQQPPTVESVLNSGQATFADLFPGANSNTTAIGRILQSNSDPCQPMPVDRVQRVGQVVAIVRQLASRRFVGTVKPRPGQQPMEVFEPLDTRQPRCNVPRAELLRFGDVRRALFVAELADWAPGFFMPRARICHRLGDRTAGCFDLELETRVILEQLGIETVENDPNVRTEDAGVVSHEMSRRWDFRDASRYCVFTVDKEMARDLDDSVHYRALDDGYCEVGVHIADVSHYVRPGSQVDTAARARAAATYLVQRTCNMLPQRLCEDLCSLSPHQDKLAFSIVWQIDPRNGEVKSTKFGKSIIRSCCQLSYPQAQRFIEGHSDVLKPLADVTSRMPEAPHTVQSVANSVRALHGLAMKLLERRLDDGALIVDPPRLTFRLSEATNAPPIDFELQELSDSNCMIEELMLLANCSVALKLRDSAPQLAFLRQQAPPTRRALQILSKNSAALGVQLDVASSGALQASMRQACNDLDPEMQLYLQKLCVTQMPRAQNFCIGAAVKHPDQWRHYSLSAPVYANFTSPIRRYADVIVHRQLCAALCAEAGVELDESAKSRETVQSLTDLARQCNKKEKDASEASRRSTDLYYVAFLQSVGTLEEVARVVGVLDKAVDVFLIRCGLESRIYVDKQEELREFHGETVQGRSQLKLHFKGCDSASHVLTLAPKSRLDVSITGCQYKDGRPLRLTLRLKPPACELCDRAKISGRD